MIVSYDGSTSGNQDRYDLPVHDGKLDGRNNPGQHVSLTRVKE